MLDNIMPPKMEETYSNGGAICPYCLHLHEASDDNYHLYDEDCVMQNCHSCGKDFRVSVYVWYSWTCKPTANAERNDR